MTALWGLPLGIFLIGMAVAWRLTHRLQKANGDLTREVASWTGFRAELAEVDQAVAELACNLAPRNAE